MISKHKLHHTAAGLLGSFISRNNNHEHLWAIGVLYTEAQAVGNRVELDLLSGLAEPDAPASSSVARTYAAYLRAALRKHGHSAETLESATVVLAFGLPPVPKAPSDDSFGDPFECRVTLVSREGTRVSRHASAYCAPHTSPTMARAMAMRDAGWRLLRLITQRSRDHDGRWPLEVLRDANAGEYEVMLDLLHERAQPPAPANLAVSSRYAAMLREFLGEWTAQLGAAAVRIRFSASSASPLGSAYVETNLMTPEGYSVWFNTYLRLAPAPPWEGAA